LGGDAALENRGKMLADDVEHSSTSYGMFTPKATMIKGGEEVSIVNPRLTQGESTVKPKQEKPATI